MESRPGESLFELFVADLGGVELLHLLGIFSYDLFLGNLWINATLRVVRLLEIKLIVSSIKHLPDLLQRVAWLAGCELLPSFCGLGVGLLLGCEVVGSVLLVNANRETLRGSPALFGVTQHVGQRAV